VTTPPALPRCGFNPNASFGIGSRVFDGAAAGDLASIQGLVEISMEEALAKADDDPYAIVCAAETLAFARICASHRLPSDVRKLAAALCLTSDRTRQIGYIEAADNLMGDAIAILEQLADEGDVLAALASSRLAETSLAAIDVAKIVLSRSQELA
jgi:hypothetical protein